MSVWSRARWIRECVEASDVGITGSDWKGKDASFCWEEESILRDDSPPNLQGLTFDMKSYCAGVLSPKFIHQLFTVDGDRISVGNYKGWVFSLRQKECDTANTPRLMWQSQCPRSVRGGRIIYVLENSVLGQRTKKKADTLF